MNTISNLLATDPYSLNQKKKEKLLYPILFEMAQYHYKKSKIYKKLADTQGYLPENNNAISDIPYIPVTMFKTANLISTLKKNIAKTLYSSSTSGTPSVVHLDRQTAGYQMIALSNIMKNYLGSDKRVFIVFDAPATVKSKNGTLSSRSTAIRGFLSLSKKAYYVLNDDLTLNKKEFKKAIANAKEQPICFFGFTWLIYSLLSYQGDEIKQLLPDTLSSNNAVLHIGGWKKLQDKAVSKSAFNSLVSDALSIKKGNSIDFYGMTEQLGTVYPDCPYGYKHLPAYSELIIRDYNTLESLGAGETGFINLLSPLPVSYPGVSVLSDDIGTIKGIDDCKCGRKGKYFIFEKRSETAELKGCGDVLRLDS